MLFGLPSMNVPQIPLVQPVPAVIPEIPIAKRKDQRGVAKIALFAYHRQTGSPVWQSGLVHEESSANDVWIMGAGPFQRGSIYDGTAFNGKAIGSESDTEARRLPPVNLAKERVFTPPQKFAKQSPAVDPKVAQAGLQEPATKGAPIAAPTTANAATSPPATAAPKPAQPQQTVATPSATPGPMPRNAGLSANVDAKTSEDATSAYLRPAEAVPLPQPRFNSPK
jgi:hypothetical protein